MLTSLKSALSVTTLLACAVACSEPPPVSYETRHLEIATDFDDPVCEGTLNYLDSHVQFVESELGLRLDDESKIRVYWLEDSLDDWCRSTATGCYYPGTRVLFSQGRSITHELVHALLNAEAHTSLFIEEGLAELYSGVGSRHRRSGSEAPPVAELVWLTPEEYRARELDYTLAVNFVAWLRDVHGEVVNQRLAEVVTEGGGPEAMAYELERLNKIQLDELEQQYGAAYRSNYKGLRNPELPLLELDLATEIVLGCDDELTMGPLPSGEGGMYRVFRLRVNEPEQMLDLRLYAASDVRVELIDLDAERRNRNVVDWFMPRPSEELAHPQLRGTQELEHEIEPGSYLLYVSTRSYERQTLTLAANLRRRPFPHPLPLPTEEIPPLPGSGGPGPD